MARIKFGIAVGDIRGSIAGSTFSSGTYGAYVRRKAVPTNTNTTAQGINRANFATLSASWRGLTNEQRETWITQAPNYTRLNSFGDNVPLTGQALYMRCNLNLISIGVAPLTIAVPPVELVAPVFDSVTAGIGATAIDIDQLNATPADVTFKAFATRPFSQGVKFNSKSDFRAMATKAPSTALGDLDISAEWNATFGYNFQNALVGTSFGVQVSAISHITGQSIMSARYVATWVA